MSHIWFPSCHNRELFFHKQLLVPLTSWFMCTEVVSLFKNKTVHQEQSLLAHRWFFHENNCWRTRWVHLKFPSCHCLFGGITSHKTFLLFTMFWYMMCILIFSLHMNLKRDQLLFLLFLIIYFPYCHIPFCHTEILWQERMFLWQERKMK